MILNFEITISKSVLRGLYDALGMADSNDVNVNYSMDNFLYGLTIFAFKSVHSFFAAFNQCEIIKRFSSTPLNVSCILADTSPGNLSLAFRTDTPTREAHSLFCMPVFQQTTHLHENGSFQIFKRQHQIAGTLISNGMQ